MNDKKIGRPTENPKTIVKRARMSEDDVNKLKECSNIVGLSESEVIRIAIKELYNNIK